MGALVTLELAPESPILALPWIVTFGPLSDDEDWEPVVCGPYERRHALALAEEVVADDELMAVVEPLMSFTAPDEIRSEIDAARAMAAEASRAADELPIDELDMAEDIEDLDEDEPDHHEEPAPLPTPDEVRAGMARIAHRIAEPT